MDNFSQTMHHNTTTSLLSQILISIFRIHMFLTKITVLIFETFIIHRNKFAEYLALYLFDKIVYCVPVDEVTFFGVMGVEIEIEGQAIFVV